MFAVATQNVGQLGFTSKSKWASKELGAPLCARTHSAIFISEGREARAYETCLVGSRLRVAVGLLSLAAAGCWMQWHMHLVYRYAYHGILALVGSPLWGTLPIQRDERSCEADRHPFEGIGALSAGASSRLLQDPAASENA